uniref:Uncharacterized protein n=1 Tax=Arundo donax TaxID=35708 RepID=A0A0A9B3D3_ARUDO
MTKGVSRKKKALGAKRAVTHCLELKRA